MLNDRHVNGKNVMQQPRYIKTKSVFTCKYFNSDIPSEIIK